MVNLVCEREVLLDNKIVSFYSDIEYINEKLIESEKSPVQSIESAYIEGWK